MEKINEIIKNILSFVGIGSDNGLSLRAHWKIVVYVYLTLFIVLIILGWLFYSWIIQTEIIPPKVKSNKPDITTEELVRAKNLSEDRKDKLDKAIQMDVRAIDMK